MRNYIHIMLCVSLFMAQLVFIIGVDKTKNEVIRVIFKIIPLNWPLINSIESLLCCSYFITIFVSSYIHVDVNGGCGRICNSCTCFCH